MGIGPFFGSLDIFSVDQAFREDSGSEATIDLSGVQFIDAYALVAVACHVAAIAATQMTLVTVVPPDHRAVANYASRMHLPQALAVYRVSGLASFPAVHESELDEELLPLTVCVENEYEQLANILWAKLQGHVSVETLDTIYEGINELGMNVQEHSQSGSAYVAAQTYRRGTPSEELVFAMGDIGVGLRESLARLRPRSDREAVSLAITEGVSASGEQGRGVGLPTLIESVKRLRGTSAIRSGEALFQAFPVNQSFVSIARQDGTLVGARVRTRPGA